MSKFLAVNNTSSELYARNLYRVCGGISSEWSYVTASPSCHDPASPVLSPVLFMHIGHLYVPPFKIKEYYLLESRLSEPMYVLCRIAG